MSAPVPPSTERAEPPPAPQRPSLLANAVVSWAMFAGRAGLAFLVTVLVARHLGPEGRGEVTYVMNLAGLLTLIASAGTGVSMIRAVMDRSAAPGELYRAGTRVGLMFGVLLTVGLAIVGLALPSHREQLLIAAIVATPLVLQADLQQAASLDDQLRPVTWTNLVGVLIHAVGTVVTVASDTATVRNNLVLWAVGTAVSPLLLYIATRHRATAPPAGVTRSLLQRSWHATASAAGVLVIWRADVVLVELRRGYEELGLYSVAVGAAEILVTMAIGLRSAVLPHHNEDGGRVVDVICLSTRLSTAGLVVLAAGMAITSPWMIPVVFGEPYRDAVVAFCVLLPGVVGFVLHYPLFDYLSARGRTRALTALTLVALVANVGLDLVLLRTLDYTAAAVISSGTYLVLFAGCVELFVRTSGRSARSLLVIRSDDLASIRTSVHQLRSRFTS